MLCSLSLNLPAKFLFFFVCNRLDVSKEKKKSLETEVYVSGPLSLLLGHVWLFVTPWTIAHQAPQSLGFSRQEYCSGLPFPTPEDLPNPGIEPRSPTLQADSLPAESQGKPKNTGVDSLSLLQWIFLTQKLNQSLLHCRRILYQINYHGSPNDFKSNQIRESIPDNAKPIQRNYP